MEFATMIKTESLAPQSSRQVVSRRAHRWASRDDFDLTNGWLSAGRGEPYDRDASALWKEGYLLRVISRIPKPKIPRLVTVSYSDASKLGQIH
jgi:hypothetical protein